MHKQLNNSKCWYHLYFKQKLFILIFSSQYYELYDIKHNLLLLLSSASVKFR